MQWNPTEPGMTPVWGFRVMGEGFRIEGLGLRIWGLDLLQSVGFVKQRSVKLQHKVV